MRINLMLGVVWLIVGTGLLVSALRDEPIGNLPHGKNAAVIGGLAVVLGLYNFARFWASRPRRPEPPRVQRRPLKEPTEYHPEFDFGRPEPPPTKPEAGA